ncbi:serine/threonine-protein kinase/endoribonuclease IRE1 [Chloropicon roscoffensis]|uniref:Serine/threonine-protein kinase/endoribonuclease IRE1 n=1 Tax=Chloropicon roscoffensis TaxID=1461544 RepID=A0AAX4PMH6_9CHLO
MARSATQQPTALLLFVLLVVLVSSPSITLATSDAVVKDLAFRRAAERHDGGGRATEPPQPMQLSVLVETVDGRVHAFDALSGERLWTSRAGGALVTTSISSQRADDVAPKSAIVPGVDGHLYSIKAGSRAIRRLGVHATDVVRVSPNIAGDGSIVLGSKKDAVFVLHPLTGEVLGKVSSDEAEKSPTRVAEVLESATVVVPGAKGNGGGGGAESLVPKANGAAGQGGGKIVEELRPVLVSRTEYVIKAFNHRHNEELWNVSYTDCKQLSAAEGNQIWGARKSGAATGRAGR